MKDTTTNAPIHYLRASNTRKHIATFQGPVPRKDEIVWVDPENSENRLEYRVERVEWQMEGDSGLYARVYLENLMDRPDRMHCS